MTDKFVTYHFSLYDSDQGPGTQEVFECFRLHFCMSHQDWYACASPNPFVDGAPETLSKNRSIMMLEKTFKYLSAAGKTNVGP